MALFGLGTNIINADPVQQALARRQSGMPTVGVSGQMSGAAPGEMPPMEPKVTPGQTASPLPDPLAQMARSRGQMGQMTDADMARSSEVGQMTEADMARSAGGNPELEMIVKALIERMKQIGKAEMQQKQLAPTPSANDFQIPGIPNEMMMRNIGGGIGPV